MPTTEQHVCKLYVLVVMNVCFYIILADLVFPPVLCIFGL